MIMAQEIQNVDYESMVEKYMNEWDGCNLREFCFSEKVNIYRMLKTMKKMGVKKEVIPHGLRINAYSGVKKVKSLFLTMWHNANIYGHFKE